MSQIKLGFLLLWGVLGFLATGCGGVRLQKMEAPAVNVSSSGGFCLAPPKETVRYTKILFVVDKSGSNARPANPDPNNPSVEAPPSDPNNVYRADSIERFWAKHKEDPYIKWGYIAFGESNSTVRSYINDGKDSEPSFSQDPQAMENALDKQRTIPDDGCTPYLGALSLAQQAIARDVQGKPEEDSRYMVFFMSDGFPTDTTINDNGCGSPEPAGPADFAAVDAVMTAAPPGRVHLSAIYYGAPNPLASKGLETMAGPQHGRGMFKDLNVAPREIDFDKLLVGGGEFGEIYQMKPGSFLVYNLNSSPCQNGKMGMDSDMDGLCDEDEIRFGKPYDPKNRFSFEDGYSDWFHFQASLSKEPLLFCEDRSDEDHDLLTTCEEAYALNATPTGTTHHSSEPTNPDTDGDGLLDSFEMLLLGVKSAPMDQLNIFRNYDSDSDSAITQVRQHRNPRVPDAHLTELDTYDSRLDFARYNDKGQSCYSFSQNYLKTFPVEAVTDPSKVLSPDHVHEAGQNLVLIYYLQTVQSQPAAPGVFMYSLQKVWSRPGIPDIKVSDEVFKSYVVPVTVGN